MEEVRFQAAPDGSPEVHLIDATYELFRAWFGAPPKQAPDGREVGAVRGLLASLISLLKGGATHVGCATDHVIRSFRNDLYDGYKTEAGVPEALLAQFPLAETAMRALGLVVWPMVEFEADDALATAAARYRDRATRVLIATPDKDLAQCVVGDRVVMLDRRKSIITNEDGVVAKWGVSPKSIPDWLALVGDTADGYPGLRGWGEKSASAVLAVYESIEAIPREASAWKVKVRGAPGLAATLDEQREDALLFKRLATLRTDAPVTESIDELAWRGARPELRDLCAELGMDELPARVSRWIA
jgi:5'-3' exonuclease